MDRLDVLIAKDAIRDLAGAYSMAVDDHDIDAVLGIYTPDATFAVAGSTLRGHDELREFYIGSMDRYTTMLHTPEIHLITVESPTTATGRMTGHAELAVRDTLMLTAFRYADRYVLEGEWRFQHREVTFMYAVPFEAMSASFRTNKRIRWPQTRYAEADYPESAPTWSTYRP
ncbi:nuclear transport factor 2 family protein [Rhodococcus sp. RS1C4]|uniref:nuclear transport factor 2 family protein n=1 Tax=Rhodococcus sp. 114MFTsu3.1 TaxID=1172184 RepID=UPI000371940B|nr:MULTISPECIES: nuclear transport factor 2 family protein [unclassified Rhodococcus (in: high G+C Gram-positive bacteria)]OZC53163.1 nuclear transport factor 2 family protein [Rhodococcus sp. RS1C4]OZC79313.1 nuclear transport factor 2 family protein [Rhodococcus sp. 06-418-1B]